MTKMVRYGATVIVGLTLAFEGGAITNHHRAVAHTIIGSSYADGLRCNEDEVIGYDQTTPGPRNLTCIPYENGPALGH